MARDYRKLRTFQYAEELAFEVYKVTRKFPRDEMFGLTSQMRRAGLSVPANIVEGAQRRSEAEFIHFLSVALGSAGELGFYLDFAGKLEYLTKEEVTALSTRHSQCVRSLQALIRSFEKTPEPAEKPSI